MMKGHIDKFLLIEKENELYSRQIRGYSFWTYNRFDIFMEIDKVLSKRESKTEAPPISQFSRLKRNLIILSSKRYNIIQNGEKSIWVFTGQRRIKDGNKYRCIFTDSIINNLDSVQSFEFPYNGMHFEPTETKELQYMDRVLLKSQLRAQIYVHSFLGKKGIYKEINENLRDIFGKIKNRLEVELDIEFWTKHILRKYFEYQYLYSRMYKLINNYSPKVIIEVCYYSPCLMIINEICKKEKIISVELQHAAISENHIAYNYVGKNIPQFPELFFGFSDYWKKKARIPIQYDKFKAVGYAYFEENIVKYEKKEYANAILIISQPECSSNLIKLAIELTKMVGKEYTVIYKLHPSEYVIREKYVRAFENCPITIVANNETSIYYFFSISIAQVGAFSTALYEGMGYGLFTFIMNDYRTEDLDDLVIEKKIFRISEAKEICEKLFSGENIVHEEISFFKSNALQNIAAELKELL